ncbi:MAG: NUDIX hydrolase [Gordonia sp. (in: high G+C Gram-positive bacteria)]|uniref:NUDIX hydrolase n=1 Tax=Gordonia sp. (in: high G+C Gram-positive bacteria) TaxID=84139 RepID=UPI0039E5DC1F
MSAESSMSRPGVSEDVPAAGDPQPNRNRRNRRGRRRRGRRGKGGQTDAATAATTSGAAVEPDSGTAPAGDDPGPKPSDLAAARRRRDAGAAAPRGKKRNPGAQRKNGGPEQRLRTVRETSAGGLVLSRLDAPYDEIEAVLIGRIDRRGRMMWSLPKGHIETGETAETTAVREVTEETGVSGSVIAPLGKIDYWFVSEGKRIHKTVHHFLLRYTGGELSDADYEVSEVAWVPLPELPRRLTYSDERRLARTAEGVIEELRGDPDRLARSEAEANRTEPNDYEKAAAARNQRRKDPAPPAKPRRRRRRPRRPNGATGSGSPDAGGAVAGDGDG